MVKHLCSKFSFFFFFSFFEMSLHYKPTQIFTVHFIWINKCVEFEIFFCALCAILSS